MIDLHIHLLPGVDDGASDVAISHAMLARAQALGFDILVATPHLPGRLEPAYRSQIEQALVEVRAMAPSFAIDIEFGFEIALTPDLPARLEAGEPATLGGSQAVLVDLPFSGWPLHVESTLFELQVAGFRPVLAHPERYVAIQQDSDRARSLADRGTLLQATTGSFVGIFGQAAQRTAERLLQQGAIHLVATDAHSTGARFASVDRGLDRIRTLVGEERLRQLVDDVPRALLDDADLPQPVPHDPSTRSWLDRARHWFVSFS